MLVQFVSADKTPEWLFAYSGGLQNICLFVSRQRYLREADMLRTYSNTTVVTSWRSEVSEPHEGLDVWTEALEDLL